MTTSTLKTILETLGDDYGILRAGTNTGASTSALTDDVRLGGSDGAKGLDRGCAVFVTGGSSGSAPDDEEVRLASRPQLSTGVANLDPALTANLVVVGDSDYATNNFFNLYGNGDFFLNIASWLLAEENLIAIRPKQRKSSPMPLTQDQGNFAFVVGVGVIPSLMMLAGFRVWWKRRSL